jgi:electron transport complex protein RnfD
MELQKAYPPHIRSRDNTLTMTADVVVSLLPLYAMSGFFFGLRVIILGLISVSLSFVMSVLFSIIKREIPNIYDQSNLVTGLIIPLFMPPSIGIKVLITALVFALAVAKYPFGGLGQNIFNPAAAGIAFAILCWPREMFKFALPFAKNAADGSISNDSVAHIISMRAIPSFDILDILLGNVPGAIGTTHILLLASCFLFLLVRKAAYITSTLVCLASAFTVSVWFPVLAVSPLQSAFYEICSGSLVFCAVFLINDPVTTPKRIVPRAIFSFLVGIFSILFNRYGNFEDSVVFVVLLSNSLVWHLDMLGEYLAGYLRRRKIVFADEARFTKTV